MSDALGKGLESLIPHRDPERKSAPAIIAAEREGGNVQEPEEIAVHTADNDGVVAGTPGIAEPVVFSASATTGSGATAPSRSYQDHFQPRRGDSIYWIELERIEPNPFQPRREFGEDALRELADSIREHGVLQPILVTKREQETSTGLDVRYQLIAGERRWRAAKLAGLSQVPAVIRRGMPDDRIKLELAIIENVQREDLNAMDRALAYKQLTDQFHLVQREIAARIGKSREMVANTLRLLALSPEMQGALRSGKISEGHARAILMAGDDAGKQAEMYTTILSDRLNVREAEGRARQIAGKSLTLRKRPASDETNPEMRAWTARLQDRFGTKVRLQRIGERGKIVVEFYSEEELRALLQKLVQEA
ncbi:MAG: ParB/RepB/Spo0J family partition protein [bacterium]|nr:ParB/RepB/Spo0J family partition protein [bacterium]MDZ4299377.1 ParB/RepB/Spo0J family partition protein [Candidatus Sungbacteria bacterium]